MAMHCVYGGECTGCMFCEEEAERKYKEEHQDEYDDDDE